MSDYHICLEENNREFTEEPGSQPLAILLRASDGRLMGGLRGATRWGYLCIDWLAIRSEARRGGYGTRLLAAAEQEARTRGCRYARLDTFSFQALPFYQKLGYDVVGVIDDFPPGHRQYYLRKTLAG